MFSQTSVILFTEGRGGLPNGGDLLNGGLHPGVGLHPGGEGGSAQGVCIRGQTPPHADCTPPHPSASTRASGTHPTRMHSCFQLVKLLPYYSVHQVILNSLIRQGSIPVGCILAPIACWDTHTPACLHHCMLGDTPPSPCLLAPVHAGIHSPLSACTIGCWDTPPSACEQND